jgi:hypothetical protein
MPDDNQQPVTRKGLNEFKAEMKAELRDLGERLEATEAALSSASKPRS